MPELPEVEVIRKSLSSILVGKIVSCILVYNSNLRYPISEEIELLCDQFVVSLKRRAKYLLIEFSEGILLVHFGMTGSLRVLDNILPVGKHDYLDICLRNGISLRYSDPRRLGSFRWINKNQIQKFLSCFGPEPLSKEFNGEYLFNVLSNRKSMIKSNLMDSKIVAGIGNIYANESLYIAGIFPKRSSKSLNFMDFSRLVNSIKYILVNSIKLGGTTIHNFRGLDGKLGLFSKKLRIYGKYNQMCLACNSTIICEKVSGRCTYWCPICQR